MSAMMTRAKKARMEELALAAENITELPDDCIFAIVNELTTKERSPLALVCKKFRALDLKIGKRTFDTVFIDMEGERDVIKTDISRFETVINGEFAKDTGAYFNGATAATLVIRVGSYHDAKAADALSTVFKSFTFKHLELTFTGPEDLSPFASRFFHYVKNKYVELERVGLGWYSPGDVPHRGFKERSLRLLPAVKDVRIFFGIKRWPQNLNDVVLNDETLLYLVNHASHNVYIQVLFKLAMFTAQGIFNAFEAFCMSSTPEAVTLLLDRSLVDDFLHLVERDTRFQIDAHENIRPIRGLRGMLSVENLGVKPPTRRCWITMKNH